MKLTDVDSYMLAQLPSNMILTRVRPSLYLPACAAVWSCVSAATAGTHNYSGLIAVRFFLGIVEAPFFPGVWSSLSLASIGADLSRLSTSSAAGIPEKSLRFVPQCSIRAWCSPLASPALLLQVSSLALKALGDWKDGVGCSSSSM